MLLLLLCKIMCVFLAVFLFELSQGKEQFLIDATDAGGQTEDQDCFPHPDVDRFQGATEPQRRTRK